MSTLRSLVDLILYQAMTPLKVMGSDPGAALLSNTVGKNDVSGDVGATISVHAHLPEGQMD